MFHGSLLLNGPPFSNNRVGPGKILSFHLAPSIHPIVSSRIKYVQKTLQMLTPI